MNIKQHFQVISKHYLDSIRIPVSYSKAVYVSLCGTKKPPAVTQSSPVLLNKTQQGHSHGSLCSLLLCFVAGQNIKGGI